MPETTEMTSRTEVRLRLPGQIASNRDDLVAAGHRYPLKILRRILTLLNPAVAGLGYVPRVLAAEGDLPCSTPRPPRFCARSSTTSVKLCRITRPARERTWPRASWQ